MKPRLGPFVCSMRPSLRRALGGVLAGLILSLLYSGSYAVLRLNGYLVRGSTTDYGDSMYAGTSSRGAYFLNGEAASWGKNRSSPSLPPAIHGATSPS